MDLEDVEAAFGEKVFDFRGEGDEICVRGFDLDNEGDVHFIEKNVP